AMSNLLSQDLQSGFPVVLLLPKLDYLSCDRLRTSAAGTPFPIYSCAEVETSDPFYLGLKPQAMVSAMLMALPDVIPLLRSSFASRQLTVVLLLASNLQLPG